MKLRTVAMTTAGLVLATQVSAADIAAQAPIRPGTSVAAQGAAGRRVALAKGARSAAPVGAESAIGGEGLIPALIGAGVVAGAVVLVARDHNHKGTDLSTSP